MIVHASKWDDLENYRASLEHYGVPGMKWGVRKQRESTGRKRSASSESSVSKGRKSSITREQREKAKAAKKKAAAKAKAEKEATRKEARRKKILSSPSKLYKHRNEFTYDEIKKAMERFEWEKKLNSYSGEQLRSGAEYIGNLFKLANNSINLYNTAARIVDSVHGSNLMPVIKTTAELTGDKKDKKKT